MNTFDPVDPQPDQMKAVEAQLERIVSGLRARLGETLLGVYLHGSLAMSGFNPRHSDIDLLAVTRQPLPPEGKCSTAALLLEVSRQPAPVEISVLAWDDLHPWQHPARFDLHYSESWRERYTQALAGEAVDTAGIEARAAQPRPTDGDLAAHVTVVRARGRVLYGLPIAEVFPVVPAADYLNSIDADLEWAQSQANPAYQTLNVCRTMAFLADGGVRSKAEGGVWGLAHLPESFHSLIQAALAVYQRGAEPDAAAQPTGRIGRRGALAGLLRL